MSEETRASYKAKVAELESKIDAARTVVERLECERAGLPLSEEDRLWFREERLSKMSPLMRRFVESNEFMRAFYMEREARKSNSLISLLEERQKGKSSVGSLLKIRLPDSYSVTD